MFGRYKGDPRTPADSGEAKVEKKKDGWVPATGLAPLVIANIRTMLIFRKGKTSCSFSPGKYPADKSRDRGTIVYQIPSTLQSYYEINLSDLPIIQ